MNVIAHALDILATLLMFATPFLVLRYLWIYLGRTQGARDKGHKLATSAPTLAVRWGLVIMLMTVIPMIVSKDTASIWFWCLLAVTMMDSLVYFKYTAYESDKPV